MTRRIAAAAAAVILILWARPAAASGGRFVLLARDSAKGYVVVASSVLAGGVIFLRIESTTAINRWFPKEYTTSIDEEYLSADCGIIKFRSQVLRNNGQTIRVEGERFANELRISKWINDSLVKNVKIPISDGHYTFAALSYAGTAALAAGCEVGKKRIHLLDKKDMKWRTVEIKSEGLKNIDLGGVRRTYSVFALTHNIFARGLLYFSESGELEMAGSGHTFLRRIERLIPVNADSANIKPIITLCR